jgi:hypothetical protein
MPFLKQRLLAFIGIGSQLRNVPLACGMHGEASWCSCWLNWTGCVKFGLVFTLESWLCSLRSFGGRLPVAFLVTEWR